MCIRDRPHAGHPGHFPGFVASFMALFAFAGIGNGSTFCMIPVIFQTERQRAAQGRGCLLYTSDAADERSSVDLGGRRILKKKKKRKKKKKKTSTQNKQQ